MADAATASPGRPGLGPRCVLSGVESPGRARRVRLAGPCSSLVLGLPATGSPDGGVLPARGTGSKGLRTGVSRGLGAARVPSSAAPWVGERSGAGCQSQRLEVFSTTSYARRSSCRSPIASLATHLTMVLHAQNGRAWQCAALRRCKSDGKEVVVPNIHTHTLRPQKTNAATARHPIKAAITAQCSKTQPYDCASSSKASL